MSAFPRPYQGIERRPSDEGKFEKGRKTLKTYQVSLEPLQLLRWQIEQRKGEGRNISKF